MSKSKAFLRQIVDEPPPCTDEDPELFSPISYNGEHEFQVRLAKSVCRKCPLSIKAGCLEFALETNDQHTVMGGTTPSEREVIRKRRAKNEERRQAA